MSAGAGTGVVWARRADPGEMGEVLALREEVFCGEQGVPLELERDGRDEIALHLVAVRDGRIVGTCRLLRGEESWRLGRMAVRRDARGAGAGAALLDQAHAEAGRAGAERVTLAAQVQVRGFYERFGYVARGEEFVEAGIQHVRMSRRLTEEERR